MLYLLHIFPMTYFVTTFVLPVWRHLMMFWIHFNFNILSIFVSIMSRWKMWQANLDMDITGSRVNIQSQHVLNQDAKCWIWWWPKELYVLNIFVVYYVMPKPGMHLWVIFCFCTLFIVVDIRKLDADICYVTALKKCPFVQYVCVSRRCDPSSFVLVCRSV